MTIIRTCLIGAFGLLATGLITPASAGLVVAAKPIFTPDVVSESDVAGLHAITDRGSWKKPKSHFKRGRDYGYDRHYRKHYKKKRHYRRGFRRGFDRGYDEGYYDGRRHSRFDRYYYPRYDYYRGGVFFGDGYGGGGSFRFRF